MAVVSIRQSQNAGVAGGPHATAFPIETLRMSGRTSDWLATLEGKEQSYSN